ARNEGALLAKGSLLLFIDDDIDPSPGFIKAHVLAHDKADKVVIGYLPFVMQKKVGFFGIKLRLWWDDKFLQMRKPGYRFSYEDLISGNFSIPSVLFRKINGFDKTLRLREDYELGMRLIKSGAQFDFSTDAWGYHCDEATNLSRSLKRKRQEGNVDVQFGALHPELLRSFWLAEFKNRLSIFSSLKFFLVFNTPMLGDLIASSLKQYMSFLEWMRWRSPWNKLNDRLHQYWYLRGTAEKFTSKKELINYLKYNQHYSYFTPDLTIDLKKGIAEVEQLIDLKRPESVQLIYGDYIIGTIDPIPGAERLRSDHLKKALASEFSWDLMQTLALDQNINKNFRKELA
ncbi:MAG TPA: galactosyltransferase-related protein, partial [Chitinophagaceae bacterium]|nr:galactosyltransferase-related protein [Chitinophagaceae bacterium]